MIDLNEIEVAARKPWYCRSKQEDNLLRPEILVELITSLREEEKDASRYRWLRSCTTVESKKFVSDSGGWIVGLGVLDGMIDQAMKEKGDE